MRLIRTMSVWLLGCGMAVCAGLLVHAAIERPPELAVYALDVGQGDALYILMPDGTSLLIDGGPDNTVLQSLGEMMPWWDRSLEYVISTHPDRDHFAGLLGVFEKYDVGELLYNGDPGDAYYAMLLHAAEKNGAALRRVGAGTVYEFSHGITLRFLWPPTGYRGADKNSRSLVALLSWNKIDFLLTGDAGQAEELVFMEDLTPRIEVLKAGHHGSNSSSASAFLARIDPAICVISAGTDNRYGHPHRDVLDRLHAVGCSLRQTTASGTIGLSTDGREIHEHLSGGLFSRILTVFR